MGNTSSLALADLDLFSENLPFAQARLAFRKFDRNRDGVLQADEARAFLKYYLNCSSRTKLSKEELLRKVDALFARLDVVSKLNSQSGMAVLHTSKVNLFDMANPRTNSSDSFKRVRTS